jgi:hypothetical protein
VEFGRFLNKLLETEASVGVDAAGAQSLAIEDVLLALMELGFSFVLPLVIAAWGYRSQNPEWRRREYLVDR